MSLSHHRCLIALFFLAPSSNLVAQTPVIDPNGIVNAASLATDPLIGPVLVSRRLSTIRGQNLAADTAVAQGFPLPTTLAGTAVLVNGSAAYLVSVAPDSITFQAPTPTPAPLGYEIVAMATVVVTTAGGSSDPFVLPYLLDAAGLYTQDGTGCGQGLIYNIDANGAQTLNSPSNSASPGDYISIRGTGFFGFDGVEPADGSPAISYPSNWGGIAGTWLGINGWERSGNYYGSGMPIAAWTRLLIGQAGIDEARIVLSPDAPEGCAVPLRQFGGRVSVSQPVLISIHKGGGQCQDPPPSRAGAIHWSKTIDNPASFIPAITETFKASFVEAPQNLLVPPLPTEALYPTRGPNCPGTGGRGLDAGSLMIQDQTGDSIFVQPATELGTLQYLETSLPLGTIRPGALQLSSPGGSDLGAFQTEVDFPREITILERFQPGDKLNVSNPSPNQPFTIHWIGGTADVNVEVDLAIENFDHQAIYLAVNASAPGDAGVAIIRPVSFEYNGKLYWEYLNVVPGHTMAIIVTVTPSKPLMVQVPGIDQSVKQDWSIQYRFRGLLGI